MAIAEDQQRARQEGVACAENLPFLLEPTSPPKAGVLLVHGFTASPWEMRLPADSLAKAGYLCLGIRLPGHGTVPRDLIDRKCEEWLDAVEEGLRLLKERTSRVYGVGSSTGALLLLPPAAQGKLNGLILLSPYLRLRHRLAPTTGIMRFFKRYQSHPVPADLAKYYYALRPLNGVYQLYRLIRRVRDGLGRITAPALVICAQGDRTVNLESAYELYQALGSPIKEHHLLGPEAPHVLTTGENPRLGQTLTLIRDFLNQCETSRQHR